MNKDIIFNYNQEFINKIIKINFLEIKIFNINSQIIKTKILDMILKK
jgi:hypothetical protein